MGDSHAKHSEQGKQNAWFLRRNMKDCTRPVKELLNDNSLSVTVYNVLPSFIQYIVFSGLQIRSVTENYYSYFSTKTYVVGTQKSPLDETVLLSTQNTCLNY